MKRPPLLSVSMAPHVHVGTSVADIYWNQALALAPAAIGGIVIWGLPGLRTLLLAMGAAMVIEWLVARLMHRERCVGDASALAQGMMLGMLLQAHAPWWLVVVGALLMVVLGKQFFGGLGGYPLNPVLLAYAVLLISWPGRMSVTRQLVDYATGFSPIEPLVAWRGFGIQATGAYDIGQLFLGQQVGGVGSAMGLLVLIGGLYLIVRGMIAWRVPVAFLAGAAATTVVFNLADPAGYPGVLFQLVSGITIFTAFFLMTDFTTTPVNPWAQVVYGLGGGLLLILIRTFGGYPEGAVFAVLLMNLAHPLIDRIHTRVIAEEVPAQ